MRPDDHSTFIAARDVRQALVASGDIRSEIEFQNDINGMLARIEDPSGLEVVEGPAGLAPRLSVRTLRVLRGGVAPARVSVEPPPFRRTLARTG